MTPHRLIAFNKPYGVLSQFTDADGHPGLAHHIDVPGVYPAGRLDRDSEGLLLLTSDGQLQHRISDPPQPRTSIPKSWRRPRRLTRLASGGEAPGRNHGGGFAESSYDPTETNMKAEIAAMGCGKST